jgi:hypothetical protein
MTGDLTLTWQAFTKDRKFSRKGPLSVALVVTQHARNMGLPLDPEKLLTEGGGQALGLGKSAVQAILHRHEIERVLAARGHAAYGWRETRLRSRAREIPAQQLHDLGRAVWPQRRLLRRRRGDPRYDIAWGSGHPTLQRHLNDGHRPILVTRQRGLTVAEALAENVGLGDRIDIFEIEQFIALNLYEMGKFVMEGCRAVLKDFVTRYNEIIDEVETDPSLRIELRV